MQKFTLSLGIFLLGGLLVWLFLHPQNQVKMACNQDYAFLSGDIDCESIDEKANQIENLHSNIQQIIDNKKQQNHIIRASVFYRDLNTRRWFGVNDIDNFYPASLIKLPIAILYYKIAELQPDIFDKKMQIPADMSDNSDQHYPPADPLVAGQSYAVKDMLEHMLKYSDNAPFQALYDQGGATRDKVLSDLSIYMPSADSGEGEWSVTARNYANIFRMLYNASYVNVRSANEILSILSQSTFTRGIVAGVPPGVKVAHKFGEATATDAKNNIQSRVLNDCGIVYKKDNPYILCIMTEGNDYVEMEKTIQQISESAYSAL
ncbi:MAG: class A beta-lactamase-related serine hydrolase [Candidatus Moranbacteria bacterium]|nr:class A beta-lactamase-related serine hydrolase [Candidatus Moranbacteria bacterium]